MGWWCGMCWRSQAKLLGLFEDLNGKIAADRWKSLEKVIEGLTIFQTIEQRLYGHPRPSKNGRSVHQFRVPVDSFLHASIAAHEVLVIYTAWRPRQPDVQTQRTALPCH